MAYKETDNSFVMIRPQNGEQALRVDSFVNHEKAQAVQQLYTNSFAKYFCDVDGVIPKNIHREILKQVLPTMALIIHSELPDETEALVKEFMATAKKPQIDKYNSYSDQETSFYFVLLEKVSEFKAAVKKHGFEAAHEEYTDFFELMKTVYMKLPSIFLFNLIEAAGF